MTMTGSRNQLLKQRLFYRGRKFDFEVNHLRLPNQAEGDWECIRHPGGALLSQSPQRATVLSGSIFAVQGRILEFPAGTVEPNEDPAETIEKLRKKPPSPAVEN